MSTKSRHRRPVSPQPETDLPDPVAALGEPLLETDDPLAAELLAAMALDMPRRHSDSPRMPGLFLASLARNAGQHPSPAAAALLRALTAVAAPQQRRRLVEAMGKVTEAGYYPPGWASLIGRAVPREARLTYDVFRDTETVAVSFGYGDAEHAIVVRVDRCREPTVLQATIVQDVAGLWSTLDPDGAQEPLERVERIDLADARARLESAVASEPAVEAGESQREDEERQATALSLPIVRSRLRRLPSPTDRPVPGSYSMADREAAVTEFLASSYAAGAGDEKTARFWAEVLTGYSSYVPGDPPARVGPRKLAQLLLRYVPFTFALTDEQRRGLPDAVTAWTRWAADRQGLDEPAQARLTESLSTVLGSFDAAYDHPDSVRYRGYLADLAATTTDAAVLADAVNRRALAVPFPENRGEQFQDLDVTDPAHRRTLVEQEYGDCDPPEGMAQADFLAAAVRVCEQLWHDDPPELWQQARELAADGTPDHDVVHELVARAAGT